MKLIRTAQFDEALRLMEEGGSFTFITGRAGTGKSTLLHHFCGTTSLIAPVLAPTGVAALNVGGETIHRFFRFAPGITVAEARKKGASARDPEMYRRAEVLVIDEISMVRADLLDCMDQFLRAARKDKSPFGGLRIVAIGDLYQLPPVVTAAERGAFTESYASPYFFASRIMQELLADEKIAFIELEKVYRQTDATFISLLNAIRNRSATYDDLARLNARVREPQSPDAITLTAMNAPADELNNERLRALSGSQKIFNGELRGDFPEREAPTDLELGLKKGARVMCVANDSGGRFVNGSLGWVTGFKEKKSEETGEKQTVVLVKLDGAGEVSVGPHTWTIYRSVYDRATSTLNQERLGSFTQIPLRLAWAVTIHKSQGKTFNQANIDLGRGAFAAGQTYVGLSRCRTLDGISLARPIRPQDIRLDYSIVKFITSLQYGIAEREMPLQDKIGVLRAAAKEKRRIKIIYLKGKDEKSERYVIPRRVEQDEYAGHEFLALRAWCELRNEERTFNVARILRIE